MGKLIDMTGWKMWQHGVPESKLQVIERYPINGLENKPQWRCKCLCGAEIIVLGKSLRNGNTKSCGCRQKELASNHAKHFKKDLTEQKIGYLTVLEDSGQRSGSNIIWKCLCQCGNICYISSSNLGKSTGSCGCKYSSIGEQNIENYLKRNNYNYIRDKIYFKDLLSIKGYPCRYDFIILNDNNEPYWLIEFDGRQHKEPQQCKFLHADIKELQANDQIKNKYAISHHLPLVRIPYSQRNNITYEILFGTTYLLPEFKI